MDLHNKLIDLEKRGVKIKIGIVGVGQMGSGLLANLNKIPGMEVCAVATKDIKTTLNFSKEAGYKEKDIILLDSDGFSDGLNLKEQVFDLRRAKNQQDKIEQVNKIGLEDKLIITNDSSIISSIKEINVVIDATGKPDIGAFISFNSIINKKHVVTLNFEGDSGPYIQYSYARASSIIKKAGNFSQLFSLK